MQLRRAFLEKSSLVWMITGFSLLLIIPVVIGLILYVKASPLLEKQSGFELLFSSAWIPSRGYFGFWPFIASSLYVTLLSFLLSAPVCLLSAVHLTQFAHSRAVRMMQPVLDILAGIPSVVYGVWGILIVVPFISRFLAPAFGTTSSGYSLLAGGIVLAIMCIPYMLNMLIEVFQTIPLGMKEASLSLGATEWQVVKHVVFRKGFPGMVSAFGLSVAKAFGETIAVMMVVGNQIQVRWNPLESGYPLPALIANNYGEMLSVPLYDSALMFSALVLFVIILIINIVFRYIIHLSAKI
jgi:phosphate transport system permease protein